MCNGCNKFLYNDLCDCTSTEQSAVHLDDYLNAGKDSFNISTKDNVVSDSPCLNAKNTDSLQNNAQDNSFLDAFSIDFNFNSRGAFIWLNLNSRHE